jgi:hypothetical protein
MEHSFPRGHDACRFCGVSRERAFVSRTECREVLWGWSEPKPDARDAPDARLQARGAAMKSINTFAKHADRSRTWVYQQIRAGHLEAVRAGKRYVITAEAEQRFYQKVNSGELAEK